MSLSDWLPSEKHVFSSSVKSGFSFEGLVEVVRRHNLHLVVFWTSGISLVLKSLLWSMLGNTVKALGCLERKVKGFCRKFLLNTKHSGINFTIQSNRFLQWKISTHILEDKIHHFESKLYNSSLWAWLKNSERCLSKRLFPGFVQKLTLLLTSYSNRQLTSKF